MEVAAVAVAMEVAAAGDQARHRILSGVAGGHSGQPRHLKARAEFIPSEKFGTAIPNLLQDVQKRSNRAGTQHRVSR